jgi:hypothetical protein
MKITQLIGRPVRRRRARRQADAIRAKTAAARRQLADTDALLARRDRGAR